MGVTAGRGEVRDIVVVDRLWEELIMDGGQGGHVIAAALATIFSGFSQSMNSGSNFAAFSQLGSQDCF